MITYLAICLICAFGFAVSLLHDDVDIGDAIDLGEHDGSWLSVRAVMLFGVGFGSAGTIAMKLGTPAFPASLYGVGVGLVLAALGLKIARVLQEQEADSTTSLARLIGRNGVVSVPISPEGLGQVVLQDEHGHTAYVSARARVRLNTGDEVIVLSSLGTDLVVAPVVVPLHR